MAGREDAGAVTGHIGTNTPKFVPSHWGRPPFDPTQTGLCKFGWVWSSLILSGGVFWGSRISGRGFSFLFFGIFRGKSGFSRLVSVAGRGVFNTKGFFRKAYNLGPSLVGCTPKGSYRNTAF